MCLSISKSNLSLSRLATSPIFFYCFFNVLPLPTSYDSGSNPRVVRIMQLREIEVKGLWPLALPFVLPTVAVLVFCYLSGLLLWVGCSCTSHSHITLSPARSTPHVSPSSLEYCLQVVHRCEVRPKTHRHPTLPSP